MKILVKLSCGKRSYVENVSDEIAEAWKNIDDKELIEKGYRNWVRKLKIDFIPSELDKYNGNHFVFGWIENFSQSENIPVWMQDDEQTLEVIHEQDQPVTQLDYLNDFLIKIANAESVGIRRKMLILRNIVSKFPSIDSSVLNNLNAQDDEI